LGEGSALNLVVFSFNEIYLFQGLEPIKPPLNAAIDSNGKFGLQKTEVKDIEDAHKLIFISLLFHNPLLVMPENKLFINLYDSCLRI